MLEVKMYIDVLTTPERAFKSVADLMQRGHCFPDVVTNLRELEPRREVETGAFLPGQRVAFESYGQHFEHMIAQVHEWDDVEAHVVERVVRSPHGDVLEWRLAELTAGMIRIELTYRGNYGGFEKLTRTRAIKKFYEPTLERLKIYLEDLNSFAGPRTFAPRTKAEG